MSLTEDKCCETFCAEQRMYERSQSSQQVLINGFSRFGSSSSSSSHICRTDKRWNSPGVPSPTTELCHDSNVFWPRAIPSGRDSGGVRGERSPSIHMRLSPFVGGFKRKFPTKCSAVDVQTVKMTKRQIKKKKVIFQVKTFLPFSVLYYYLPWVLFPLCLCFNAGCVCRVSEGI